MNWLCQSHQILVFHHIQCCQSRDQHNWVNGFPEPVKSFITFVILSQISCGKVQNPPHIFLHKTVSKFSSIYCCFQDYLDKLKKKRKILRDWVHTSVGRSIRENCSEPRTILQIFVQKNMRVFFSLSHEIRLSITKVMNDYPYL